MNSLIKSIILTICCRLSCFRFRQHSIRLTIRTIDMRFHTHPWIHCTTFWTCEFFCIVNTLLISVILFRIIRTFITCFQFVWKRRLIFRLPTYITYTQHLFFHTKIRCVLSAKKIASKINICIFMNEYINEWINVNE